MQSTTRHVASGRAPLLVATFVLLSGLVCLQACRDKEKKREAVEKEGEAIEPYEERIEAVAAGLESADWKVRYKTLLELGSFGAAANDAILPTLGDRNEVVSRTAQAHLIGQGEAVVPYLVTRVVETDEDVGLYARISGQKERTRGKSLAGTLWLALARGTGRDRCFELVEKLLEHDSPRVRAVALFTAASIREARFIRLLEKVADDGDPMVRERLREALVQLISRTSPSTPRLDAEATEEALSLMEGELIPILSSDEPGVFEGRETLPEVLAAAGPLEHGRKRLVEMLVKALEDDALSPAGALVCGRILASQSKDEETRDIFERWAGEMVPESVEGNASRRLSAMASFPAEIHDLEHHGALLDLAEKLAGEPADEQRGLPLFAANTLVGAIVEGDSAAEKRAGDVLSRWLSHEDDRFFVETALAHEHAVRTLGKKEGREDDARGLVEAVKPHLDRVFSISRSLPPAELLEVEELFILAEDDRYVDVFEMAWAHRTDDEPGIEWILGECLRPLAYRKEKAVLHHVLECAESGSDVRHTHLKDACIYSLTLKRYSGILDEYLTDERFERWMEILQDPEEHPRFRAGFFPLLELEALGEERRRILTDIALGLTTPPHDSNLRSKAALGLAEAGDRRAFGPLYRLALEQDHPWWVWENVAVGIASLHGANDPYEDHGGKGPHAPAGALEALVDLMDAQLGSMEPSEHVGIVHVNNYYNWGIQYLTFPPRQTADLLKRYTKQDFGYEVERWRGTIPQR
jgi:HEAT repeat protein